METNNPVTVYGKPGCVQCDMTKKVMDKEGISYSYLDITASEVAHQEVKNLGYSGVPVVKAAGHQPWQGFSPDKIKQLKQ